MKIEQFSGNFSGISGRLDDQKLHQKFIKLGNDRRRLTNQLLAILPEIFERKIYKKYAATIEEYAGKFGGLSKGVVKKRLRLEKYLKDKPALKAAVATVGIHKVALVASLATVENEAALVDKLGNMSKAAVQELSREMRQKNNCINQYDQELMSSGSEIGAGAGSWAENGHEAGTGAVTGAMTAPCSAAPQSIKIELKDDLFFMFLKLKKKYGEKLSNQEVMKKIFEENLEGNEKIDKNNSAKKAYAQNKAVQENEIINEKLSSHNIEKNYDVNDTPDGKISTSQSVKSIPGDRNPLRGFQVPDRAIDNRNSRSEFQVPANKNSDEKTTKTRPVKSRYIPIPLRRNLLDKTHGRCSYPECNRPSQIFHHTERFAISHSHSSIRPLCKIHHEFAHNGLIKNEKMEAENWQLQLQTGELDKIDRLYREYRKLK